ncbi:MAG: hypothetical protein L3J86_03535, partial [Thermoplasmata archaeon]|nr:hypothetical protein [Thermoplasmata archaeon]
GPEGAPGAEPTPVARAVDRSNTIWAPHAGQPYWATPRCLSGVRHFGHGIGRAVTQAANISCSRRSTAGLAEADAPGVGRFVGPGAGRGGVGNVGATAGAEAGRLPLEKAPLSRPHCGQ